MLKSRIKRRAAEDLKASWRLAAIEESIVALNDEDLLDLADIFARDPASPLQAMAAAEMSKRRLSL